MTTRTILSLVFVYLCGVTGGLFLGYAIARVSPTGAIIGVVLIVIMMGALKRVVDVDPS